VATINKMYIYLDKMNTSYLLLGSNLGNRKSYLDQAIALIEKRIGITRVKSNIFITAAWGNTNQDDFYNQAICIETQLNTQDLLENVLKIEEELGRKRDKEKWQARTIDIDILFFNDEITNTPNLIIPHPFIQDRKFVLAPLHQIAPQLIHPQSHKSIETLLLVCEDSLKIEKLSDL
jgi:2-amino-4-hydroxy-6-hydroxymethyldihydropteridine diphosphokinase